MQYVPEDLKDEKYWARRRKNNMAAKRSRDARRVKENQIAMRAAFLEKEVVSGLFRNLLTKYGNAILSNRLLSRSLGFPPLDKISNSCHLTDLLFELLLFSYFALHYRMPCLRRSSIR